VSYVEVFCRCLIGVVFLVSAVSKLRGGRQFREFASSLRGMRLLPGRLVAPVAAVVAAAELAVPVLLAPLPVPSLVVAGFALAALLLAGFAVAIVVVLRRGVQASCRCFGGSGAAPFGWHHVIRNGVLTVVAALGGYAALGTSAVDLQALALTAPLGLVAALVTVRLDDIVDLFSPMSARRQR
jgi:hypothetical protein